MDFWQREGKTWTQTIPNGKGRVKKESFYNPVKQNNTHIKWLKKMIGNEVPIYSVIAFSERCTLKNVTIESPDIKVLNRQHIGEAVKYMGSQSTDAINSTKVESIYAVLYPYTQVTEYQKLQHINHINEIKRDSGKIIPENKKNLTKDVLDNDTKTNQLSEEKIVRADMVSIPQKGMDISVQNEESALVKQNSKRVCPRCSAELVLRTAKKGEHKGEQFYGCSRFPKCRYKENI